MLIIMSSSPSPSPPPHQVMEDDNKDDEPSIREKILNIHEKLHNDMTHLQDARNNQTKSRTRMFICHAITCRCLVCPLMVRVMGGEESKYVPKCCATWTILANSLHSAKINERKARHLMSNIDDMSDDELNALLLELTSMYVDYTKVIDYLIQNDEINSCDCWYCPIYAVCKLFC